MRQRRLACLATVLTLASAGCNIIGPAVYFVHGPEKIDAEYKLDKKRSTVIFVDDPQSVMSRRSLKTMTTDVAQKTLLDKRVLNNVIDGRAIATVVAGEDPQDPLSLDEIGREIGAEVLIYVKITKFVLTRDGSSVTPLAEARVKVIDVTLGGANVWPGNFEGEPLRIEVKTKPGYVPGMSRSKRQQEEDMLADRLGIGIAQLFYQVEIYDSVRISR